MLIDWWIIHWDVFFVSATPNDSRLHICIGNWWFIFKTWWTKSWLTKFSYFLNWIDWLKKMCISLWQNAVAIDAATADLDGLDECSAKDVTFEMMTGYVLTSPERILDTRPDTLELGSRSDSFRCSFPENRWCSSLPSLTAAMFTMDRKE